MGKYCQWLESPGDPWPWVVGANHGETDFVICYIDQFSILCENAFVDKLGLLAGFDAFHMLVVDFMHECELGTWKALFTHLICLLYALPGGDSLGTCLDNSFIIYFSFLL
jgi:hypothetical protein